MVYNSKISQSSLEQQHTNLISDMISYEYAITLGIL